MKRRKTYDRAFKDNAVNLSHSRSDLSALARELGISSDSLYRWRKESEEKGSERFPGKGNSFVSVEAKSDEALHKKIKCLEQENEIEYMLYQRHTSLLEKKKQNHDSIGSQPQLPGVKNQ